MAKTTKKVRESAAYDSRKGVTISVYLKRETAKKIDEARKKKSKRDGVPLNRSRFFEWLVEKFID